MATPEMLRSVAVLSKIPELIPALNNVLPRVIFQEINPGKVEESALKECEVLIADCSLLGPYLYNLPKVKWVQTTWAGVETLFKYVDSTKPPLGYPVVRFSDHHLGRMMAEYVVGQLVSHERDFDRCLRQKEAATWEQSALTHYRTLADLTVAVLGVGTIGLHIAQALKHFGAKTWGLVRTIPEIKSDAIDEYRTVEGLDELLGSCDVVVSALPETEETRGLLGRERLARARRGLVLLNLGRGSLLSEADLLQALAAGHLSAALLDVFPAEPLPPSSPLWSHPQVRITPHVSGVSRAVDLADVFRRNLRCWTSGLPFSTPLVDFDRGY